MLVYRGEIKMNSIHNVHDEILVISQGKTVWVKKSGCSLYQKKKKKFKMDFWELTRKLTAQALRLSASTMSIHP